jgi:polyhydroxybutyrate depolymerase
MKCPIAFALLASGLQELQVQGRKVPGAWCNAYRRCADGAQVQLCVTDTGGHSWPGADRVRPGKGAASTALDASAVIWRFFDSQAPRPGNASR